MLATLDSEAPDNPPDASSFAESKQSAVSQRRYELTPSPDSPFNRRGLITAGVLGAALLALERTSSAQLPGSYDPTKNWLKPELRLVRRITLGLDSVEAARALKLGYDGYLEYQLNYTKIDDSTLEKELAAAYPTLAMTPFQMLGVDSQMNMGGTVERQLVDATLFRSVFSGRQLYQRMVEFWTDHFNIELNKVGLLKSSDDRDVIRVHALGKFPEMLMASAHSPAMMEYLDNARSKKAHPNQNYARELMELHTLSVKGPYTQTDVQEVARCLTGWSRVYTTTSDLYGTFIFNTRDHDNGAKTVLGNHIPENGGAQDGVTVMRILAEHPSTASFISTKMCRWLLRYDPSAAFVSEVAQTYLKTGGDIKAMIRVILKKSNLVAAPAKYKRPYHLVVSAMRATGATLTDPGSVLNSLSNMGQYPFHWAPPNGYPDALEFWAGLVLPRWDFAANLAGNGFGKGTHVDVTSLLALKTPEKIAAAIIETLFAGETFATEMSDLVAYLKPEKPTIAITEARVREAVGLALASLNFQYY